jgi:hypothetical protein
MDLWICCGNENAVFTMGWKNLPRLKKEQQVRSNVNVSLAVFSDEGVVYHEFLYQGQTANCWYYF